MKAPWVVLSSHSWSSQLRLYPIQQTTFHLLQVKRGTDNWRKNYIGKFHTVFQFKVNCVNVKCEYFRLTGEENKVISVCLLVDRFQLSSLIEGLYYLISLIVGKFRCELQKSKMKSSFCQIGLALPSVGSRSYRPILRDCFSAAGPVELMVIELGSINDKYAFIYKFNYRLIVIKCPSYFLMSPCSLIHRQWAGRHQEITETL